jgi:hypothetical protein
MPLIRRFLVITALMFWQGGFTFYAAVVVPIAQERLGHLQQGFITRRVTNYINLAGGVSLAILAWDTVMSGDASRFRRRGRWATWLMMLLLLGLLIWLHVPMDAYLDPEAGTLTRAPEFRTLHRSYLWLSTAQWGFGIAYLLFALQAWRVEDRQ